MTDVVQITRHLVTYSLNNGSWFWKNWLSLSVGRSLMFLMESSERSVCLRDRYMGFQLTHMSDQAFQSLITIYILFPPVNKSMADRRPPALADLALRMEDRLQYQCAGYIQAEAERFGDEILELEHAQDSDDDNDTARGSSSNGDDSDDDSRAENKSKNKSNPSKRRKKADKVHLSPAELLQSSRKNLETEFAFSSVVFYFMRGIQVGVIDIRHSAVLLAYYGRLGGHVDHCVKPIVDGLRHEGVFGNNGEVVVHVVTESIRKVIFSPYPDWKFADFMLRMQSFEMFMDGLTQSEESSATLAKLLGSSFVVRGAQLSITRRLAGRFVVDIHTSSLSWIIKRISGYETSGNKKKKSDSIEFFRVLQPLLATVESGDAIKM